MKKIQLEVATPKGLVLSTEVESVSAPSVAGEFTVLSDHLPVLASVAHGVLKYKLGTSTKYAAVGNGFIQAEPGQVLLLTDQFTAGDEVDMSAAEATLSESQKGLKEHLDPADPVGREFAAKAGWSQALIDAARATSAN